MEGLLDPDPDGEKTEIKPVIRVKIEVEALPA